MSDQESVAIFTFGLEGPYSSGFVEIVGQTAEDARESMKKIFGTQWAFQYESREQAGVGKYALRQVDICHKCNRPQSKPWGVDARRMAEFWHNHPRGICQRVGDCEAMRGFVPRPSRIDELRDAANQLCTAVEDHGLEGRELLIDRSLANLRKHINGFDIERV